MATRLLGLPRAGARSPVPAARTVLLRAAMLTTLATVGLLASSASALAAIDLGAGGNPPSIAYDPASGYTYVAWEQPSGGDTVDVCSVPSGGTVCNGGSGPYALTDPLASSEGAGPSYFGAKVLVIPGGTVVVVANVDGASNKVLPAGYTSAAGEIAWSSPAGGEAFGKAGQGLANGGKLLAEARGEMPDQGALGLNPTTILTYGNTYPFESGATDFTLGAPAPKETPLPDASGEYGVQLFVDGSLLAAEEEAGKPGDYVVVVVGSDEGGTPSGCPAGSDEGTGYGVAKGSPKQLQEQAAWSASYFKILTCRAEGAVLPSGGPGHAIGVVQSEGSGLNGSGEDGIYFRPFETGSDTFGEPVSISQETPFTLLGPVAISASEDAGAGLYALWGDSRGFEYSYSSTQGLSWLPAVTALPEQAADPIIAGVGSGTAEAAYTANLGGGSQEYLQGFNYTQLVEAEKTPAPAPAPPPPTPTTLSTTQSGGGISGASLTVPQGTAVTDQAHIAGASAANATGTVTYTLYKNNRCTQTVDSSVESVVKGVATASTAVKPGAGTYYWRAAYSGDAANDASASNCGSEILVVALSAKHLGLPSTHMCLSRRKFVVHPRAPKGVKLVSVEVQINGKFVKKGRLSKHATSISLVGLPKGTFKVALITTSSKGKIYEEVRTFHTCVPGKHKKKK